MRTSPGQTCRACFIVLLAAGLCFLFIGLLIEPFRPVFQLDAVLTPEELLDPRKRDATAALLRKAAGNEWLFWTAGGLIVTVTSILGLRTVREAGWQKIRSDDLKDSA